MPPIRAEVLNAPILLGCNFRSGRGPAAAGWRAGGLEPGDAARL